MANIDFSSTKTNKIISNQQDERKELIQLIISLLCNKNTPEEHNIDKELFNDPDFQKLYRIIIDLRTLSSALTKGDLQKLVYEKGIVLANLKSLQANLRHLTWQTQKISDGDFSQKVDFLGDFSESFNKMTVKLQNASLHLIKLASLDPLTQIPNRLSLTQFLDKTFKINNEISILMIDIDYFKNINDNYGHDAGDNVLVTLSDTLNSQMRSNDFVARYGGEEFVAVLPNTTIETAKKIAERILHVIQATTIKIDSTLEINTTISIGISSRLPEDETYDSIIKRSDNALYEAKRTGRNKICIS